MSDTLTQPIKWHGGKHYLADQIIELMPPHLHYVEPYFGGGSVLLQKDPEGVSEVVNDIDGDLMNFWAVLRSKDWFHEFKRYIEATPFAQPIWENSNNKIADQFGQNCVSKAFHFFVLARQSRQGLMKNFATLSRNRTRRGMNEQVSSWLTAIEGLPDVHARLKRVVVLNDDGVKVIKQQDGPNTLFYCDPTYLHDTRVTTNDYKHEMNEAQHIELLNTLAVIKGKFLLSGYRHEVYDLAAAGNSWHREDIPIDNKASSKKVKDIKTECLWMNFNP